MIAGKAGAIEIILNAMKTHTDNIDMCECCCEALQSITCGNGIINN